MALKESKKRNQVYGDDDKEANPKKRAHIMKTRSMTKYDWSITKDLPQEVIMEIFSRLPWLSIMKLRLVFPSIMQRPDFERMYLQSPLRRSTSLFVATKSYENNPIGAKQVQIVEYHHGNHRIVSIKLDFTKLFREHETQSRSSVSKIVGCCNGLLLLSTTHRHMDDTVISLHLVNPITRSSVKLLDSNLSYEKYALGYSSNTRLYKVIDLIFFTVIRILTVDPNNAENTCWRSCSIASKTNRLTCKKLYSKMLPYVGSPLPLHGAIHWLTELEGAKRSQLIRFHVDEEEFDLVPLPYEDDDDVVFMHLNALHGLICVLDHGGFNKLGDTLFITVWVMKEYGVQESWEKLTTMSLRTVVRNTLPTFNVIDVLENGKLLLRLGRLLRLYDPKTKTWDEKKGKSSVRRMNTNDDVITNFFPSF